jgi:hypothetical protein
MPGAEFVWDLEISIPIDEFQIPRFRLIIEHAALDFSGRKFEVTHPQPLVACLPELLTEVQPM